MSDLFGGVSFEELCKLGAGHMLNLAREQCITRMGHNAPLTRDLINGSFRGIGQVVNTAIAESEISKEPVTAVSVARSLGLLPPVQHRRKSRS